MVAVGEAFMDTCQHLVAAAKKEVLQGHFLPAPTSTDPLPHKSGLLKMHPSAPVDPHL
jgi:hypothetical protein